MEHLDVENIGDMPQKRYYRSRAHCNPLSHNDGFSYPVTPDLMDWSSHFTHAEQPQSVDIVDIGCGFGGLTVTLASMFPNKNVLGMEIRAKVCEYVRLRVQAMRKEFPGRFHNASCLRTNGMRYLPNFFHQGQLEKMFFMFPDPHFKNKNHRRRIINLQLLSEYAYVMKPNGRLYTATDVEELHKWHVKKCSAHRSFRRIPDDEILAEDPCVAAMLDVTEEGKKVARNKGSKFFAVYRRITPEEEAAEYIDKSASEIWTTMFATADEEKVEDEKED